jgi:4-hydroxy-tetrahydrodipicolinate synthase
MSNPDTQAALELRGVFSVVPTPFLAGGELDELGVGALARAHVAAGVRGLVLLGVMGEATELDEAERRAVLRLARAAAPEAAIVVGVSGATPGQVTDRAAAALAGGAGAGMVSPTPSITVVEAARAVADAGLAVILQDYPAASSVHVTADELAAAARAVPGVVGIKVEAPPTSGKIAALRVAVPEIGVMGGLGGLLLLDELAAGATGVMTGFPIPERLVEIVATHPDDPDRAAAIWTACLPLMRLEAFVPLNLAARKEAWRIRGVIGSSHVRRAGADVDDRARSDIERAIRTVESALATLEPARVG